MGYIQEPEGIDFYVVNEPLTDIERKQISDIITTYKLTGKKTKRLTNQHAQTSGASTAVNKKSKSLSSEKKHA